MRRTFEASDLVIPGASFEYGSVRGVSLRLGVAWRWRIVVVAVVVVVEEVLVVFVCNVGGGGRSVSGLCIMLVVEEVLFWSLCVCLWF